MTIDFADPEGQLTERGKGIHFSRGGQVLESICSERAFVFELRDMRDTAHQSGSQQLKSLVSQRKQALPLTRSAPSR
jgi:hypothetical protein